MDKLTLKCVILNQELLMWQELYSSIAAVLW